MTDIEKAINEKKAEIKRANRELSKLQDELKRKDEPRKVHIVYSSITPYYQVVCYSCDAQTGASENKQEAIDAWNKRV